MHWVGGCLPGGSAWGVCPGWGCLPRGMSTRHPCEQNDWQTPVKILPCLNFVADGKNHVILISIIKILYILSRELFSPKSQFIHEKTCVQFVRIGFSSTQNHFPISCIQVKAVQTGNWWCQGSINVHGDTIPRSVINHHDVKPTRGNICTSERVCISLWNSRSEKKKIVIDLGLFEEHKNCYPSAIINLSSLSLELSELSSMLVLGLSNMKIITVQC